MKLTILGNAALEGADALAARFTGRSRKQNYTQIFTATVDVTGTMQAVRNYGVHDELDFQKQERLRELLRDLENCVINGTAPAANPQGSSTVRRSMNGIIRQITTNQFTPGSNGIPEGGGDDANDLTEDIINTALRLSWEQSSGKIDTIVVNGLQKRRINQFINSSARFYQPSDQRLSELVSANESDIGVCRVILSRWMPSDSLLLLDSSRIEVLPLAGRSFHYKPLAATGDSVTGQLIGEYTTEVRNENAHALIRAALQRCNTGLPPGAELPTCSNFLVLLPFPLLKRNGPGYTKPHAHCPLPLSTSHFRLPRSPPMSPRCHRRQPPPLRTQPLPRCPLGQPAPRSRRP